MTHNTFIGVILSIKSFITSFVGMLSFLLSILLSLVLDNKIAFLALFFAMFLDLIWGITAAIVTKNFILSRLLKLTLVKIAIYMSVCLLTIVIERGIYEEFFMAERFVFIFASLCEFWSVVANMLIVKPDMPFLKIFRKLMIGEIAQKLRIEKEEVEKILFKPKNNNKK